MRSISSTRKTSLTAGLFYLLTFVSIPTLALYQAVHQPGYILSNESGSEVIVGGLLEIIVALAGIATAVVLYPVLKKQNEGAALGLVASRVLEAATIFLGVAFLLAIVSLKQQGAGVDAAASSRTLVALYDRIFLLGQGFIPAINDLLLGFLLYRSGLVPRGLALLGIVGAFPLIVGYLTVMFGLVDRISPMAALSALPVAVFEFSLGLYLTVKGFRPSSLQHNYQL
ncbi:MAG: DUF4386 domain-containing protein [Bacteroidetes bacterium]|nr:DUF4386 domain-containing protein [Bacteroidota bacterium]